MKKKLLIISIILLHSSITACEPEQSNTENQNQTTTENKIVEDGEDILTPEVKREFEENSSLDKVGDFVDSRINKTLGDWKKDDLHERRITVYIFVTALFNIMNLDDQQAQEWATKIKDCIKSKENSQNDQIKLQDILVGCLTQ